MRRLDVRSLSGVVTAVHGPGLATPRLARRGDMVRRGWALGICCGEMAEFYGAHMAPMSDVEEGWRL